MTDARLPDPWLGHPQFSGLSDGAWRLFTHALMWSNRYGTDGKIDKQFFSHLLVEGDTEGQILELMDHGLLVPSAFGVTIPWAQLGQSTAEQVEKVRAQNRERKERQKEREKLREGMREVGQDRLGQEDTF